MYTSSELLVVAENSLVNSFDALILAISFLFLLELVRFGFGQCCGSVNWSVGQSVSQLVISGL